VNALDAVRAAVRASARGTLFVSALGTATSALRAATDDGPHLYLGGSMGCGLGVALGVAEQVPERPVVAILGDGDLLMGSGSVWSLAALAPANLLAVVLCDGLYAITGGQPLGGETRFAEIAGIFPAIATACAADAAELERAVRGTARPGLVEAAIDGGWPGPSPFVDCPVVRERFERAATSPEGS
jgi:thiamine pyrophosphate-dependent acetolactate synthase large subunit-like protein